MVAKGLKYAKQKMFEYGNKPNMFLARVLAERAGKIKFPIMLTKVCKQVGSMEEILNIFAEFYTDKSSEPAIGEIGEFLDILSIPELTETPR